VQRFEQARWAKVLITGFLFVMVLNGFGLATVFFVVGKPAAWAVLPLGFFPAGLLVLSWTRGELRSTWIISRVRIVRVLGGRVLESGKWSELQRVHVRKQTFYFAGGKKITVYADRDLFLKILRAADASLNGDGGAIGSKPLWSALTPPRQRGWVTVVLIVIAIVGIAAAVLLPLVRN
jgi:hypothetical protein